MYGRARTLFDHQQVACDVLGFRWMSEHQRRALVRLLGDEVLRCADRAQLLGFARRWLLEHQLLIVHDQAIRSLIAAALGQLEAQTAAAIRSEVAPATLDQWLQAVGKVHSSGQTQQSWLRVAPAKHSTRKAARTLMLSRKTVETYRCRLMHKLGVENLPALVRFAIQHGLTPSD